MSAEKAEPKYWVALVELENPVFLYLNSYQKQKIHLWLCCFDFDHFWSPPWGKNSFAFCWQFITLQNIVFCPSYYVFYLQLLGEVVGHYGSEGREQGSQEDTDITDVNSDVEKV